MNPPSEAVVVAPDVAGLAKENPPLRLRPAAGVDVLKLDVGKGVDDPLPLLPLLGSLAPPNVNPPPDPELDDAGNTGDFVGAGAGTAARRTGADGILNASGLEGLPA